VYQPSEAIVDTIVAQPARGKQKRKKSRLLGSLGGEGGQLGASHYGILPREPVSEKGGGGAGRERHLTVKGVSACEDLTMASIYNDPRENGIGQARNCRMELVTGRSVRLSAAVENKRRVIYRTSQGRDRINMTLGSGNGNETRGHPWVVEIGKTRRGHDHTDSRRQKVTGTRQRRKRWERGCRKNARARIERRWRQEDVVGKRRAGRTEQRGATSRLMWPRRKSKGLDEDTLSEMQEPGKGDPYEAKTKQGKLPKA